MHIPVKATGAENGTKKLELKRKMKFSCRIHTCTNDQS